MLPFAHIQQGERKNALACLWQGERQLSSLSQLSRAGKFLLISGKRSGNALARFCQEERECSCISSGKESNSALVISLVFSEESDTALTCLTEKTAGSLMLVSGEESDNNFACLR